MRTKGEPRLKFGGLALHQLDVPGVILVQHRVIEDDAAPRQKTISPLTCSQIMLAVSFSSFMYRMTES
jgi:hypothetical protein